MKYFELDDQEKKLVKDFENEEFVEVSSSDISFYQQAATATLNKSRNINIRLSEKDLLKLKAKAVETGIPYQTLVSSILHQYVNDSNT
jgi:predicted DNA binding CopG/RHH family protein